MQNILSLLQSLKYDEIVATMAIEETVKYAYLKCKEQLIKHNEHQKTESPVELSSTEDYMFKKINSIINESWNWSTRIDFQGIGEKKYLQSVFIPLDFYVTPKAFHLKDDSEEQRLSLADVLEFEKDHLIVIGGPGAGKTTLTKYLTLNGFARQSILGKSDYNFPLLIRLRELNNQDKRDSFLISLLEFIGIDTGLVTISRLSKSLNIEPSRLVEKDLTSQNKFLKQLAIEVLDSLNILLILDGLDEITDTKLRATIINDVRQLCLALERTKIIFTSRTGEFNSLIDNAKTLELCSLSDTQIRAFIHKWIENEKEANKLYEQIVNSPFIDTAIRPINLAHLCAIYKIYHEIPEKPKTVYEKIVHLLTEDWDIQRDISRASKFENFAPNRKREFLSSLAYTLTYNYETSIFDKAMLFRAYDLIHADFNLPSDEAKEVIKEIESHTGLFIHSGQNKFEFSHKSLQEYLTANYIIRSPYLLQNIDLTFNMANEYAIAVSLSSNPTMTLYQLSINNLNLDFLQVFLTRLSIEKPDYSSKPFLAIAISKLFSKYPSKLTGNLWDAFLYSHSNIKASFKKLSAFCIRYGNSIGVNSVSQIEDNINYQIKQAYKIEKGHSPSLEITLLNKQMMKWYLSSDN